MISQSHIPPQDTYLPTIPAAGSSAPAKRMVWVVGPYPLAVSMVRVPSERRRPVRTAFVHSSTLRRYRGAVPGSFPIPPEDRTATVVRDSVVRDGRRVQRIPAPVVPLSPERVAFILPAPPPVSAVWAAYPPLVGVDLLCVDAVPLTGGVPCEVYAGTFPASVVVQDMPGIHPGSFHPVPLFVVHFPELL